MKKIILGAGAILLLVSFFGCRSAGGHSPSGNAIVLKFNLAKGIRFDYAMSVTMSVNQSARENSSRMTNKVAMGYIFEVTNDSSGWKTVSSTINKIAMNVNAGAISMNFDTDNPALDTSGPSGMMSKIFGAMKGGQFVFTINEKGEVGEVRGMKEMMEKIMEKGNSTNGQMIMQSMGKAFDENNFRQNIAQSFAVYPENPVKPGDTWSKTLMVNSSGLPMKCENSYTLESVDGDNANIKISSKISSADSSTGQGAISLSGKMEGSSIYEISTGMLMKGNMEMKMNVKSEQQQSPITMNIGMSMSGKKL